MRIEMETFDKVCGDNRGLLAVTKNKTVCLCAVMIPRILFMVQWCIQSQLI